MPNVHLNDAMLYLYDRLCEFNRLYKHSTRPDQYPKELPSMSDWVEHFVTFLEQEVEEETRNHY